MAAGKSTSLRNDTSTSNSQHSTTEVTPISNSELLQIPLTEPRRSSGISVQFAPRVGSDPAVYTVPLTGKEGVIESEIAEAPRKSGASRRGSHFHRNFSTGDLAGYSPIGPLLWFGDASIEREYRRYYFERNIDRWRSMVSFLAAVLLTYYAIWMLENAQCGYFREWDLIAQDGLFFSAFVSIPTAVIYVITRPEAKRAWMTMWLHEMSCAVVLLFVGGGLIFRTHWEEHWKQVVGPWNRIMKLFPMLIFSPLVLRIRFLYTFALLVFLMGLYIGLSYWATFSTRGTDGKFKRAGSSGLEILFTCGSSAIDDSVLIFGKWDWLLSSLTLFLATMVSTWGTYNLEKVNRKEFVINFGLAKSNDRLRHQLSGLQRAYEGRAADLHSPLEKSMMTVKSLMADPSLPKALYSRLQRLLALLQTNDLLTPDLKQNTQNGANVDVMSQAWLETFLPKRASNIPGSFLGHSQNGTNSPTETGSLATIDTGSTSQDDTEELGGSDTAHPVGSSMPTPDRIDSSSEIPKSSTDTFKDVHGGGDSRRESFRPVPSLFNKRRTSGEHSGHEAKGSVPSVKKDPTSTQSHNPSLRKASVPSSPPPPASRPPTAQQDLYRSVLPNEIAYDESHIQLPYVQSPDPLKLESEDLSPMPIQLAHYEEQLLSLTDIPTDQFGPSGASDDDYVPGNKEGRPWSAVWSMNEEGQEPNRLRQGAMFVQRKRIQMSLANVQEWSWNIFDLEKIAGKKTLQSLAKQFFRHKDLVKRMRLPARKLVKFLSVIEEGYRDLPYHSSCHAADVLHAINYFSTSEPFSSHVTDIELLAAYTAAVIHDYDHPGVNNAFLTKIGDPKAILYNDRSILENHHVASAFAILSREECNFVELLPRDIFRQFREQVIDMVLATDIANHFQTLSTFKNKVNASPAYDFQNHDDRALLWRAIIKASDVSNVSKSWEVYSVWLERLTEEFYRQGDRERELGFTITPFMDRNVMAVPLSQINFMDFISFPLFETLGKVFVQAAETPIRNVHRNREIVIQWKAQAAAAVAAGFNPPTAPQVQTIVAIDEQADESPDSGSPLTGRNGSPHRSASSLSRNAVRTPQSGKRFAQRQILPIFPSRRVSCPDDAPGATVLTLAAPNTHIRAIHSSALSFNNLLGGAAVTNGNSNEGQPTDPLDQSVAPRPSRTPRNNDGDPNETPDSVFTPTWRSQPSHLLDDAIPKVLSPQASSQYLNTSDIPESQTRDSRFGAKAKSGLSSLFGRQGSSNSAYPPPRRRLSFTPRVRESEGNQNLNGSFDG
ncbi:hypothetical protein BJ742DRAFT_768518 [Cladochytrium replicatum]|nr:hypothetical protein BJ742DRAFT_768518 [Cladochytrium replicatum]